MASQPLLTADRGVGRVLDLVSLIGSLPNSRLEMASNLLAALIVLPSMECRRREDGPEGAMTAARRVGQRQRMRSTLGRVNLRRVIGWTDRTLFREPNCYRRVLLEVALDSGAAREPVIMGFRAGGGPGTGHIWLKSDPPFVAYDVTVAI
jgi:hypothetical protein